jgi:pimeloyl-ACP methyl ester carboxylesterase
VADGVSGNSAAPTRSVTFVLVHGAFHGGWVWRDVARGLRADGYEVHVPTLTGLGERRHLMSQKVDVRLWIHDVVRVCEEEELQNVIIVGHSFGGSVIGGVADKVPARISHMVYLDASVPASGEPMSAAVPAEVWSERTASAFEINGAPCFPAPPAAAFGVLDPRQAAWINRHLAPMPVRAYESTVTLSRPVERNGIPKTFILCTQPPLQAIAAPAARARELGWAFFEIATGHDAMASAPAEVLAILTSIATNSQGTAGC